MSQISVPENLRRFILTSVESIPYLEAMLLIRKDPQLPWDSRRLARRLYISDKKAADLLQALLTAGLLAPAEAAESSYCYSPVDPGLGDMVDSLAEVYVSHLVEVTNLVHSTIDKKAEKFANAFIWRKDH